MSIEYLTPEQAPRKLLSKDILIYANCVDSHRHNFVVGLQVEWNTRFTRRLALKASEAFVRQPSGENADGAVKNDAAAQPDYKLVLLNAGVLRRTKEDSGEWYHRFKIANIDNPERVVEGLEMVIVELQKLKPSMWSQTDKRMAALWLRFLKEIECYDTAPEELLEEDDIRQAISICKVGSFTREELYYYDEYRVGAMWEATYGELEKTITEQGNALAEKDAALARALAEKAALARERAEKDAALARERAEKDAALAEKDAALAEKDAALARALAELAALKGK